MDTTATSLPPDEQATIWYIGQHESQRSTRVTPDLLRQAQEVGYDLLTVPVTTDHFHARVLALAQQHLADRSHASAPDSVPVPRLSPLTPEDTHLTPEASNSALLALASPWIELGSADALVARVSGQVLHLEVAYAAFCGIQNIIVRGPVRGGDTIAYARALLHALAMGPYLQLHVQLPIAAEPELEGVDGHLSELTRHQLPADADQLEDIENPLATWTMWHTIRSICKYSSRLSIALEIPRQLPHPKLQSRWYSEPLRTLVLPRTSFLRNAKGYPVLHKTHQQYLSQLMRLRFPPWLLLADVASLPPPAPLSTPEPEPTPAQAAQRKPKDDPVPHLRYMRHLQQTQPGRPPVDRFAQGYQDYLQSPLQPLTDNLESITYEVFEKDPVKYAWYQRAIELALKDLVAKSERQKGALQSPPRGAVDEIVVAVVGAGRGPLVSRVLQASEKTGIRVQCWAVEKNPNACVMLQRRNTTDPLWKGQVRVVKTDMRAWEGPIARSHSTDESIPRVEKGIRVAKVEILVSELLGSFADNEMSPECLDGAQHVLHPDYGISIPQSYTAHLTPISTPRLHADLLNRPGTEKWEIPYVVMLQQFDYLSTQPTGADGEPVLPDVGQTWQFSHPISNRVLQLAKARAGGSAEYGGDGSNEHNARYSKLQFGISQHGVCHGLAGYFETVLYASATGEKVELSTNPVTMESISKDMISWFPIFFPLKTPLHVPDDGVIEVSMWRRTDDRRVWYEWVVEVSAVTEKKERRQGMSELHSSRKNGCLM